MRDARDAYERQRDSARRRSRERSIAGRDAADFIHPDVNPARKESCRNNLALFLSTYMPATFSRPFSDDHYRTIERTQMAFLHGGLFLSLVYRGFGKTSIGEGACIWAVLYGHLRFVCLIAASQELASNNLASIKSELLHNDLLYEDFSGLIGPIRAIEDEPRRCKGQTVNGVRTETEWSADRIVLPTVAGVEGSGGVLMTSGIESGIRGLKFKRIDGESVRPDGLLIEDPQTDQSARSPTQVAARLNVITKGLLFLRSHSRRLGVMMTATPIEPDDLVEQLADHTRHPVWQVERIPMVRKWSDAHETFWLGAYAKTRNNYDPERIGAQEEAHKKANELYQANRATADAGAVVSWQHCFDDTEVSALQHAYNLLIDMGEEAFESECQSKPRPKVVDSDVLTPRQFASKVNGYARGVVPNEYTVLTAFIDVHDKLLYWAVWGWKPGFTGSVVDYGTYPDQRRSYFRMRDARATLARAAPGAGREGAIVAGLVKLIQTLSARQFRRADGTVMQITRGLVDSGHEPDCVYTALMQVGQTSIWSPSRGRGIGAAGKPLAEYDRSKGQVGFHWYIPYVKEYRRPLRCVIIDVNWWKSWLQKGFVAVLGDPGSLSLFGRDPQEHMLFADHLAGERKISTFGQGRAVDEWKEYPDHRDQHWLDCSVGAAAAASLAGISTELVGPVGRTRKRYTSEDLRRRSA